MSKIEVELKDNILTIEKKTSRKNENNIEKIELQSLEYEKIYCSKIKISNQEDCNKILFIQTLDKSEKIQANLKKDELEFIENVIVVFSKKNKIMYAYCSKEKLYKKLIKIKYKVLSLKLNKKKIKIKILAYIINKYNLNVQDMKFCIDSKLDKVCNLKQYPEKISKLKMLKDKNIYNFKFNIKDILEDTSTINGNIRFELKIDENTIKYNIAKKKKNIKKKKYYYAPIKSIYVKDFALHIRRSLSGCLVLVKRLRTPEEYKISFRIKESKIVSKIFYVFGNLNKRLRIKPINLYFEKYSSKAEEGAYDLFLLSKASKKSKNYFIIDKTSEDYEKIKNEKNVVKKYSIKYYWLIYSSKNFITTEAPIHVNELRANNKILRKCLYDKKSVFLQHGITYMKRHEKNSAYVVGREAEPDYIVVGSEKEKDIITEMLELSEERILKTGLPIFSKIKYSYINQSSEDIITVMLTWKPYEEQLYKFEESSYYKNVVQMYNILKNYIDESKIIIVAHPKANELLMNTDLKENLWNKPISEALEKTKLLITDYSSVCYNSFYQGAGVIFYQPDLQLYESENGMLIPNDDEYIGKRAFDIIELNQMLGEVIKDKKINLAKLRTKEFEDNYKTINEYTDGKNIERIYGELKNLEII